MNNFTFFKKEKFIDKSTTEKLLNRFDFIYEKNLYRQLFPGAYELKKKDLLNESLFLSLFEIIKKEYEFIVGKFDLSLAQLQLHYTLSKEADFSKLPYIPHIDKSRYFKAMVYLHDVPLECGPIHLGKVKKEIDVEKIRRSLKKDYKKKGLNIIDKKNLHEKMIPLIGNAGDIIFFDTNTPHHAGKISKDRSRKVLRFDFERPTFNSFKSYVLNKFFY